MSKRASISDSMNTVTSFFYLPFLVLLLCSNTTVDVGWWWCVLPRVLLVQPCVLGVPDFGFPLFNFPPVLALTALETQSALLNESL